MAIEAVAPWHVTCKPSAGGTKCLSLFDRIYFVLCDVLVDSVLPTICMSIKDLCNLFSAFILLLFCVCTQVIQQIVFAPLCRLIAVCYVLSWDSLVASEVKKEAESKKKK